MDRSLAGRIGIGRPFGPVGSRHPDQVAGTRRAGGASSERARRWRMQFANLSGPLQGGWSLIGRHRRLRIALLGTVIALPLLAGGWLWLRHSSLVAVERVQVSGVRGPEARAIDLALDRSARQMSTLDVHPQLLLAAAAPYRVVRALQATPSFPHGLRIRVLEQLPVAALALPAGRTAVAADGVILGPALLSGSLPVLEGGVSSRSGDGVGQSVHDAALLACLTVLGAAPAPLGKAVVRAFSGPEGATVVLGNGLRVFFGDGARPHAKWLSLANVLADPSSAGATYVDVRVPERPAAGLSGPASIAQMGTQASGVSESSTAVELAGDLAAALGSSSPGGTYPSSAAPAEAGTSGSAPSGSGAPGAGTGAPTETPPTPAAAR